MTWCDCGHWTEEHIGHGQHGRCKNCYENCPAIGRCKRRDHADQ